MVNTKERVLKKRQCNGPKKVKRLQTVAYTEDKVTVYNLCIAEMPKKLKLAHIRKHFSKFGQLKDVEIINGKTRSAPSKCIIRYQNAEEAGVVVNQRFHVINYHRIIVQACPSWEQPFKNEDREPVNIKYTNLLSLNDYCLEMIFLKLDLRQQVRLSLCHQRLESIFMDLVAPRFNGYFQFDGVANVTEWELRQLFYTLGKYMYNSYFGPDFQSNVSCIKNIYSIMQECCVRVKNLIIFCWEPKECKSLFNSLQIDYISILNMVGCILKDNDLRYLRKFRNLEELSLHGNYQIRGTVLKYLHKVQRLTLYGCEGITNEALTECCKNLQLKFLDIRMLKNLSLGETSVQYCTSLETLKTTSVNLDAAKLPNLRSLEMRHQNLEKASQFYEELLKYHQHDLIELKLFDDVYIFPQTVRRLTNFQKLRTLALGKNVLSVGHGEIKQISKLNDLEEINLTNSIRIRDKMLQSLIIKCTKLKRMNIRFCLYITNYFIWRTLIILKRRAANFKETETKQPLTILVHGTRITCNILKRPAYKKNCHLLELLFHMMDSAMIDSFEVKNQERDCICNFCTKTLVEPNDEYENMAYDDNDDIDDINDEDLENMLISME